MNPILILIVVIVLVAIWFMASGIYRTLGAFIYRIGNDAIANLKADEEDKE